jgi:hypothetical protein
LGQRLTSKLKFKRWNNRVGEHETEREREIRVGDKIKSMGLDIRIPTPKSRFSHLCSIEDAI